MCVYLLDTDILQIAQGSFLLFYYVDCNCVIYFVLPSFNTVVYFIKILLYFNENRDIP
jgi:hypothetical protein